MADRIFWFISWKIQQGILINCVLQNASEALSFVIGSQLLLWLAVKSKLIYDPSCLIFHGLITLEIIYCGLGFLKSIRTLSWSKALKRALYMVSLLSCLLRLAEESLKIISHFSQNCSKFSFTSFIFFPSESKPYMKTKKNYTCHENVTKTGFKKSNRSKMK